jgi:Zn finger protein HypA/HybF involved in hydrogenase expression
METTKSGNPMKDDSTLAFLASYAKKSKENIMPQFRHGLGVVYEIEGLDLSIERIKSYEEEKLLSIVGDRAYSACPRCSSLQLAIRLNCPDCKRPALARSEIMIHYECEYSGPVEEFVSQKDSEFVCPKCSKRMKRVGIEYGKPGIGFKCRDCGRVFQYPAVNIICQNGHDSRIDEIDLKSFPVYRVNDEIRSFAEVAEYFVAVQKALASRKVGSDVLGRVKGASGATHIFPLVVETEKAHVVVDFILDEAGFDAKILQKILRAADLGRHVVLLFVPQGLVARLAAIVNPHKIMLLAVSGPMSDPVAVAEEVIKIVG